MSKDAVRVVVLSEDRQTESFIRRFLKLRTFDKRHIVFKMCPRAKSAGEQWVRERFPVELQAYRSRSRRAKTCLIVASDADVKTVEERIKSLKNECKKAEVDFRKEGEHVAFIIPRRNIETWLAYLRKETFDEETKYKKYEYESHCQPQINQLDKMCQQQQFTPHPPPPSLESACKEFKRISN